MENEKINISSVGRISRYCMELLKNIDILEPDKIEDLRKELTRSIRKLIIASAMYNKRFICVSGIQGAGKTYLMQSFYSLDDTYLRPRLGRGESIPVLITETEDISEPVAYVKVLDKRENGDYILEEKKVSSDEYQKYVQCNSGFQNAMYAELRVPYKYTYSSGVSFILLPGYEKQPKDTSENQYRNELIDFSVGSSDVAIWVADFTDFANDLNDNKVRELQEKFGSNMIFAMSRSENNDLEQNKSFLKNIKEQYGIEERVVFTGCYSTEEENNKWIEELRKKIQDHSNQNHSDILKNTECIYDEIRKIRKKVAEISDNLTNIQGVINNLNASMILDEYEKAVEKKRKAIEKSISEKFKESRGKSIEVLGQTFNNPQVLKNIKNIILGKNVKAAFIEPQERVESCIKNDTEGLLPARYTALALRDVIELQNPEKNNYKRRELIDIKESDNQVSIAEGTKTEKLINDLGSLLIEPEPGVAMQPLKSQNLTSIMEFVAEVSTYFFSISLYNGLASDHTQCIGLTYYKPASINNLSDKINDWSNETKNFVAGVMGILGIDLIEDGSINLISKIAAAFGMTVNSAASLTIGTAAIIGKIALGIGKEINRIQREDYLAASAAINEIYDMYQDDILKEYDDYMNKIKERIQNNLGILNGVDVKALAEYNAKVAIRNIKDEIDKIQDNFVGVANDNLGLFIN